jgi:hypothetical protein
MNENHDLKTKLNKALFWDVDFDSVNFDEKYSFVIKRVAEHGSLHDWQAINKYYEKQTIKDVLKNSRYLSKRDLNFFSIYFNIPIKKFRCYNTPQSIKQLWPV